MRSHEHTFDHDMLDNRWSALGWIVLAASAVVVAFLLAPLP